MTKPLIRIEQSSSTGRVILDRPDVHNAFNEVVMQEMTRAFQTLGSDPDIRTIVLQGEGPSFCAGADVHWMKRMVDFSLDENVQDASMLAIMLRTIRECPKPVIARVHGAAIGGGVGLVCACDISVAVTTAVFCLSEVKLGIIPAVISPFVLERIGMGAMRRCALTAERFDAAEALRIGLVHELASGPAELDAAVERLVLTLGANGPEALAHCKQVLSEVDGREWDRVQRLTTRRIAERRVSFEGQEGLKSFLDKRRPSWIQPGPSSGAAR